MRPNVRRLLIAFALAGIASLLLISYLQDVERKVLMKAAPESVLVARKDIPARTIITEDLLEYQKIPKPYIEPLAVTRIEDVIGLVAITDIKKGEQITKNLLIPLTTWTVLSSFIPEGYRAITIHVDEVSGVGGLILPGDEVDVIATFSTEEIRRFIPESEIKKYLRSPGLYRTAGKFSSFTTITYKGLRVLAVGKSMLALPPTFQAKKKGFLEKLPEITGTEQVSSVTLAVPKDIAKEIALLDKIADIRLALRSVREIKVPGEDTLIEPPLTALDLLKKYNPPPKRKYVRRKKAVKRPAYSYINIFKRTEVEKVKVKEGRVIEQKPWGAPRKEAFPSEQIVEKFMGSYMKNIEDILKQAGINIPCDTCR